MSGPVWVLLVEDEPWLASALARQLELTGYRVHCCATARDALELVSRDPAGSALAVVDLTLPDLPGEQLVARLLELCPSLAIIVTSGLPFEAASLAASRPGQVRFLQKPFSFEALKEAMASAGL